MNSMVLDQWLINDEITGQPRVMSDTAAKMVGPVMFVDTNLVHSMYICKCILMQNVACLVI